MRFEDFHGKRFFFFFAICFALRQLYSCSSMMWVGNHANDWFRHRLLIVPYYFKHVVCFQTIMPSAAKIIDRLIWYRIRTLHCYYSCHKTCIVWKKIIQKIYFYLPTFPIYLGPLQETNFFLALTPMLVVANLAYTKWCIKPERWPKPWHLGTHLKVLSSTYPLNTNMTGLRWFSEIFASVCFGRKEPQHWKG